MSRSRLLVNRPLITVVVGAVAVVGLVVLLGYHTSQLIDRRGVVDGLVRSVNDDTMESRLSLEEHLAGDDPSPPGDVDQRLAGALGACTTLRAGGLAAGQRVAPLAEAAQPSVGALCDQLASLQQLTGIRVADPAAHGAGSALDGTYDAAFTEALALADRVADAVDQLVQAGHAGLARLFAALVAAVVVTFGLMGVTVSRHAHQMRLGRDALEASESLLREAQRLARFGSFDSDFNTGLVSWSDELHAIMGTDRDSFSPTHDSFLAAVHGVDRGTVEAAVAEALAVRTEYACQFRIVRPDGGVRVLQARGMVVTDGESDCTRLVGVAQDITDEAELRRALDAQLRHVTCLAAVRRALYELGDISDMCALAVAALGPAMSHPARAVVSVDLDGRTYGTADGPAWDGRELSAAVVVAGTERGQVRIDYPCREAMFVPEEQALVQSVADELARGLERLESHATLAESQARFRRLVDNIPDVVFRYRLGDGEGMEYVSPAVVGLTGYRPQEFLDDPQLVRQILGGSDAAMEENCTQDPPGDDGTGGAVQLVARDGSVRWVEYNVVLVHDAVSGVVAVEGIARDVTERTAAAQALEQRAQEHAALARFGQAALTTDGVTDLYALAAAVIIETLPADAVCVSKLHPDTAAHTASDAPFLAGHGMVSEMSVAIGGRGGPYGAVGAFSRTAQAYAEAQVRFLETVAHVLGAAIERTTVQAELERSEQEFRTLAEQMPDVVARYGRDHRYGYVNPPVQALLGIAPADMIGRTHRELDLSSPFLGAWEDAHERVFVSGEPTSVEGDYPGVAGTVHLHSRIMPDMDSAGTVRGAISVTRDITELRRAEAQRRDDLARIVAAQEAERGRIGEDIHDDSIQVMTAVGMRLEMLKYQMTDPEPLRLLGRLEETVRHSIDRLRSLMFELRPPELDCDGLCPALRLYLQTTATDGLPRWELTDHATHELPTELRVVLYRIAVEAIVNARKHAEASLLTVTLDDVDGGVRLQVRDDGRGFDTADLADVGRHHIGTATMRGRAGAADGTVDIRSAPGQGTVVSAWLPDPAAAPTAW